MPGSPTEYLDSEVIVAIFDAKNPESVSTANRKLFTWPVSAGA